MRQKIELVITVLLLAGLIFASRKVSRYAASDNVKDVAGNKVVVDAGHGGSDPGKIGINGLEGKEVNLAIAQYVEELLKKEKIEGSRKCHEFVIILFAVFDRLPIISLHLSPNIIPSTVHYLNIIRPGIPFIIIRIINKTCIPISFLNCGSIDDRIVHGRIIIGAFMIETDLDLIVP